MSEQSRRKHLLIIWRQSSYHGKVPIEKVNSLRSVERMMAIYVLHEKLPVHDLYTRYFESQLNVWEYNWSKEHIEFLKRNAALYRRSWASSSSYSILLFSSSTYRKEREEYNVYTNTHFCRLQLQRDDESFKEKIAYLRAESGALSVREMLELNSMQEKQQRKKAAEPYRKILLFNFRLLFNFL